jgi:hypothetical protein
VGESEELKLGYGDKEYGFDNLMAYSHEIMLTAVILQNTVDMSLAIQTLMSQGEIIPVPYPL